MAQVLLIKQLRTNCREKMEMLLKLEKCIYLQITRAVKSNKGKLTKL